MELEYGRDYDITLSVNPSWQYPLHKHDIIDLIASIAKCEIDIISHSIVEQSDYFQRVKIIYRRKKENKMHVRMTSEQLYPGDTALVRLNDGTYVVLKYVNSMFVNPITNECYTLNMIDEWISTDVFE